MARTLEVEAVLGFEAVRVAPFARESRNPRGPSRCGPSSASSPEVVRRDRTLELKVSNYLTLEAPQKLRVVKI